MYYSFVLKVCLCYLQKICLGVQKWQLYICLHASNESDLRIQKLLNPLSRVETFESDTFSDACGQSNPDRVQCLQSSRPRSIHTFIRSSTSSSVQIKQSDLLLSFFCVFCLCRGILQAIKQNICTRKRQRTSRFRHEYKLAAKDAVNRLLEAAWLSGQGAGFSCGCSGFKSHFDHCLDLSWVLPGSY